MNSRLKAGLLLLAACSVGVLPLFAHHGNAEYENKVIRLKGTVTAWKWINPHVLLKVDVKDDKGNV